MKRNRMTVLLLKGLVCFLCAGFAGSCSLNGGGGEAVDMTEVMKLSMWTLDRDLEGKGTIGFIPESERTYPRKEDGFLYWIPEEGEPEVPNEDLFVFEPLEEGIPRTAAPMSLHMARDKGKAIGYANFNLQIDYEGPVEVEKISPTDDSIRLWHSPKINGTPELIGESIRLNAPCTVNICPVGKVVEAGHPLIMTDTPTDREYTIRITALTLGGKPVVTATVRLTSIPDPGYPWQTVHEGQYGLIAEYGEPRTRLCEVELLSYTFSEMYLLNGGE
ncbi:MAG: hypothetical protein II680_01925 [Clostridia bacterium]|nr:hypothetical protein [Clostridia bacterium]